MSKKANRRPPRQWEVSEQMLVDGQPRELRYYAADQTVIAAVTPFAEPKLCRITFAKRDGCILVSCPYLELGKPGLMSEVPIDPRATGPATLDLRRNGVPIGTGEKFEVKLAHHASGQAHFSKTGLAADVAATLPGRRSFPLATEAGRVFQLHALRLGDFKRLEQLRPTDLYLRFRFTGRQPFGVVLDATWRRKRDVMANAADRVLGPTADALDRLSGARRHVCFLGQPEGHPLRDHVLMLTVDEAPHAEGADKSTMVFFGGIDPHEPTAARTEPDARGMLAFLYPFEGEMPVATPTSPSAIDGQAR